MSLDVFLNLVIIIFLAIAIIYAMILNHRISSFKDNKKEILKAIATFRQGIKDTEIMIHQIKQSTRTVTEQLKGEINKGNLLRDDLVLLIERYKKGANIDTSVKKEFNYTALSTTKNPFSSETKTSFFKKQGTDIYQSEAERELFEALQKLKGNK